jgi:hypothetical protein
MTHRPTVVRIAAGAAAFACAAVVSACEYHQSSPGAGDDPTAAVRDFITDGVVDHNGYVACSYLVPKQQRAAARRTPDGECRDAFVNARLTLGGRQIQTVHEVEQLSADVATGGKSVSVRLSQGGRSVAFRLVKADFAEREQFEAPDTEWRIAGGALGLVP